MGKRSNVRAASAFVLIVASLGAAFGACTQYKSFQGQECLKDEECLAGSCIAGVCQQPPTALVGDAGQPAASDAGGDSAQPASEDSGDDGPAVVDTGTDSAGTEDSGHDSGEDSGHDSGHDSDVDSADADDGVDASNDVSVPSDSSDDAPTDADDDATGARDVRPDSLAA